MNRLSPALAGLAVLVVAVAALSSRLHAQGTSPAATVATGRIAVVDIALVFNEFQRQKDLGEELKAHQDRLKTENDTRRAEIDKLDAEIARLAENDPTRLARLNDLLQKQIGYKNWLDFKQAEMTRELGIWTVKIYREVLATVDQAAQRGGYDIVMYKDDFTPNSSEPDAIRQAINGRKVLYASKAVDLTQPVLDALNTAYRAQPRANMLFVP